MEGGREFMTLLKYSFVSRDFAYVILRHPRIVSWGPFIYPPQKGIIFSDSYLLSI